MITKAYNKYFQKSRSFLYPILGIKRISKYHPTDTYISIEGYIGAEEMKLICRFDDDKTDIFKAFEDEMLTGNPLFLEKLTLNKLNFYVFNLELYQEDWLHFLTGKYSKLSRILKRAIKTYYGEHTNEYAYMDTYLYPEEYFNIYAELLNESVNLLKEVGELCDSWNMEKEVLHISLKNLVSSTAVDSFVE